MIVGMMRMRRSRSSEMTVNQIKHFNRIENKVGMSENERVRGKFINNNNNENLQYVTLQIDELEQYCQLMEEGEFC